MLAVQRVRMSAEADREHIPRAADETGRPKALHDAAELAPISECTQARRFDSRARVVLCIARGGIRFAEYSRRRKG